MGKAIKRGPCFKKDHVARFGAKNFVYNDHARADRALGENGHHRKERPQDQKDRLLQEQERGNRLRMKFAL